MESGSPDSIRAAAKRASISDEILSKFEKECKVLSDELNSLNLHVRELENIINDACPAYSTFKADFEQLESKWVFK